jgi:hypothetical protein
LQGFFFREADFLGEDRMFSFRTPEDFNALPMKGMRCPNPTKSCAEH